MVTLRILLLFHFVAAFECIHILHALYNFTEHRMLSVQMRRLVAYIELASARVAAGMRHGQASTLMLVRVDFAVDGIARTAGSRSLWRRLEQRTQELRGEIQDRYKTGVRQFLKISYRIRCIILEQIKHYLFAVL